MGRLTGTTTSYSFLTSRTFTTAYTYDAENHLTQVDGGSTASYVYDASGQRIRKNSGGSWTEYFYDMPGNVSAEKNPSAWPVEYVYLNGHLLAQYRAGTTYFPFKDHLGSTRLLTANAVLDVRFTNDSCSGCSGNPVGGGDRNLFINSVTVGSTGIQPNDPSVSYVTPPCNGYSNGVGALACNGDMLIASTALAAAPTITVSAYGSPDFNAYPHMQVLVNGNVLGEWDVTGSAQNYTVSVPNTALVYDSLDYLPFGEQIAGDTTTTHKFTGKERDSESGLDEFGARYYSSALGRFTIPDWADNATAVPYADFGNPQSLNLFGYVKNNPLNATDPDGHCDVDGEHHGWFWCAAHSIGITQTHKEIVDLARSDLSGLKNLTINGQTPQDFARNATDKQVLDAKRAVVTFIAGQAMESMFRICPQGMSCAVIPLGLGSTGRVAPLNLKEQLAMEEVMAAPKGTKIPLQMNDSRWPAAQGWVKMEQTVNGVKIHWVENTITGAVDDFKFK